MVEEELIDFLDRCRLKNSEVMLCPRSSSMFDKEATKSPKNVFQNLRREEYGLLIIDQSSLLLRVIFLSSITLRPPITLVRMVRRKPMRPMLRHLYKNGFSRPIRMFSTEEVMW